MPIPDSQPMGALGQRRDDRARWHILRDGVPMCGRCSPDEIGKRAFYSRVKDRLICKHCHHEFSWRPMPSDVEFQDRGYITPCLIWKGALDPRRYGTRGHFKRQTAVHRDVYEQAHGPGSIPKGHVLHHVCEVPECVNIEHLRVLTRGEHVVVHRRTFDYAEAARMYTAGAGPTEIARHFGVKRRTAKAALERMAARGEVVLRPRRRTSAPA